MVRDERPCGIRSGLWDELHPVWLSWDKAELHTLALTDKIAAFVRLTGLDHQYAPHAGRYVCFTYSRQVVCLKGGCLIIVLREEGAPSSGFFIRDWDPLIILKTGRSVCSDSVFDRRDMGDKFPFLCAFRICVGSKYGAAFSKKHTESMSQNLSLFLSAERERERGKKQFYIHHNGYQAGASILSVYILYFSQRKTQSLLKSLKN